MSGMRDWLADRMIMFGAATIVVTALAFSLAPIWW